MSVNPRMRPTMRGMRQPSPIGVFKTEHVAIAAARIVARLVAMRGDYTREAHVYASVSRDGERWVASVYVLGTYHACVAAWMRSRRGDLVGVYRPMRDREELAEQIADDIRQHVADVIAIKEST